MSWAIEQELQYDRYDEFHYFATGKVDGWEQQSINIGKRFKFGQLRLHLSSIFASVEDLTVYVSSINGSAYNFKFLSQALNGIQDLIVDFSEYFFTSGDQMVFNASMKSNTTTWGIEAIGWAVRG